MFKRDVHDIKSLILRNLRAQGLEMPLMQKRLIDAWPLIAGEVVSRYTDSVIIRKTDGAKPCGLSGHCRHTIPLNHLINGDVKRIRRDFINFLEVKAYTYLIYMRMGRKKTVVIASATS